MRIMKSILCSRLPPSNRRFLGLALVLAAAALASSGLARIASAAPSHPIVPPPPGLFEVHLSSRSFTPAEEIPVWSRLFKRNAKRAHLIIQFYEIPDPPTRAALSTAGIALGQALSGRAYLATVQRNVQSASSALRKIRWVGLLTIGDRSASQLAQPDATVWARRATSRIELVVTLFGDGDFSAAVRSIKDLGGRVLGEARAAATLAVSMPIGRDKELAGLDDVLFIEPMAPPAHGESDRARTHVHADVGAIPPGRPTGQGVIAAIFDSAHAYTTHPDFGNRVVQGDTGIYTPDGHPTMTAGMIAGDGTQSLNQGSTSANQWRGLAPAANVRSYSFSGPGSNDVTNYLNEVTAAVQTDAVVVMNNSWGDSGCTTYPYGSYAGRAPFLDGVVAGSLGRPVPIVFSAGNERAGYSLNNVNQTNCITNTSAPYYNYTTLNHPKSAKNVIVVGAIDSFNNAMSSFSSWGPTLDGRLKPDVVASGLHDGTMNSNVSSITLPFGNPVGNANQQDYRVPYYTPGSAYVYGWFSETSAAASIVSGGLALMIEDWRTMFPSLAAPLPSTLRALLVHNALDLNDVFVDWYNPGPDNASGYGLVQINETLQSLENREWYQGSVDNLGAVPCPANVAAGTAQFKVTLAWDDPPGLANVIPSLINDLDLVVIDPAGVRQFPWTLDPAHPGVSAIRTQEDHVNNLEQVLVDSPRAGTWSVVIRGTNVPQGPQTFSVVSANGLTCPGVPSPPTNLNAIVQ